MHVRSLFYLPLLYVLTLSASPVPKADEDKALNLSRYLEYRMQGKIDLECKESTLAFICESTRQRIETGDGNATVTTAFGHATLHFNPAAALVLDKETFGATMQELEETERLRRQYLASQNPYPAPPISPMQDALERALFGNLEAIRIDDLSVVSSDPKTVVKVKKIAYDNAMKRTAKDVAFTERILGEIRLEYTDASVESDEPDDAYAALPGLLEQWFDTNDTERADYVGKKLAHLYETQMRTPFSGTLLLNTNYLGNDAIAVHFSAENTNRSGVNDMFDFQGELHNASTLFTPARKPLTPGTPDFLFKSMHSQNGANGEAYRALLAKDKRFAGYIENYDALLRGYFDKKVKTYAYSAAIGGWLTQARDAFSKLLLGRAERLDVTVTNRNGATAMQVFGMLMGQMMMAPPASSQQTPDTEKMIFDTAAMHLDVKIEAQ